MQTLGAGDTMEIEGAEVQMSGPARHARVRRRLRAAALRLAGKRR